MTATRATFEAALRKQAASVELLAPRKPPSAAALGALERRVKVKLPAQYVDFLRRRGALLVRATDAVFPRPRLKAFQVVEAWRLQDHFAIFGVDKQLDLEAERRKFQRKTRSELVPFARRAGVDGFFCFDPQGRIWDWESATHAPKLVKASFYGVLVDCLEWLAEGIAISREELKEKAHPPAAAEAWQEKFRLRVSGWSPERRKLELELAISETRAFEASVLRRVGVAHHQRTRTSGNSGAARAARRRTEAMTASGSASTAQSALQLRR